MRWYVKDDYLMIYTELIKFGVDVAAVAVQYK
jgi:hypothetical protein